jgi:copper(I)-binding protein
MISRRSIFSMAAALGILVFGVQIHADKKADSQPQTAEIQVSDAFVRTPVPGRNITAGFFTLHNPSSKAVTLVAVHADFAGRAELHSHTHSDGMMRMRKEESIEIPAQGTFRFAPGGYHVMLFDLRETLQSGDQVPLRLEFSDGRHLAVTAAVRSALEHSHH